MKKYFLITFILFTAWVQTQEVTPFPPIGFIRIPQNSINNDRVAPEIYETAQFKILRKLYLINSPKINWLFSEKISSTHYPITGIVKYTPENTIKRKIEFFNQQIWLHVFDKNVSKLMMVFVDDGFDGFVNEGTDDLIDRVGILTQKNQISWLTLDVNEYIKTISFRLPNGKLVTLGNRSKFSYESYWETAIKQLKIDGIRFNPFNPPPSPTATTTPSPLTTPSPQ